MLRERFANRYNRTLFGMYPRNRRGESSRRGEGIGSSLDRAGGIIARRSIGSKPVEAEGAPLVDTEALRAMVRLLRVVQVFAWCEFFILLIIVPSNLYIYQYYPCSHFIKVSCRGFS